jgi:hypothetical protein
METATSTPLCNGVTTVFLPGRRRIFSGTRTVMLVAVAKLRSSACPLPLTG